MNPDIRETEHLSAREVEEKNPRRFNVPDVAIQGSAVAKDLGALNKKALVVHQVVVHLGEPYGCATGNKAQQSRQQLKVYP
jgi:hypothetical protein